MAHDENVFARALGDIARRIEHDGFIEAQTLRFGLGENRSHIISRDLRLGHHDVGMQSRERRNICPDAALLCLFAEKCLPLPNCDDQPRLARVDHHAHGAIKKNQRPDVARREPVRRDYLVNGLADLHFGEGQVAESDHQRGIQQALHMLVEAEYRGAVLRGIAANALKHAVTIVQACIHKRNNALSRGPKFAIHPDVLRGP